VIKAQFSARNISKNVIFLATVIFSGFFVEDKVLKNSSYLK